MLARPVLRFYFVFQVGGKVDAKLKTFTSPDPDITKVEVRSNAKTSLEKNGSRQVCKARVC